MNSSLSIRDIASIGLPIGQHDGWLLMLKLYIDDSGTNDRSPVVGVGGVMGNVAQWEAFDLAWKTVLAEPYPGARPLSKWSSFDCLRGEGEFDGYKDPDKIQATARFRNVITNTGVFACSNMIDNVAWIEVMTARFGSRIDAESCALLALIERMRDWIPSDEKDKRIAVFYDFGRKNERTERFFSAMNDAGRALPQIASFTFARVKDASPLQAADMIATESYWFALDYLRYGASEPKSANFRHYLKENAGKGNGQIMDRETIEREASYRDADGRLNPEVWVELRKRLFQQPS